MKAVCVAGLVSLGLLTGGAAVASEQLAKDAGCAKCHDLTKDKKGPSIKSLAAKYKGKAGAADQIVANLKAEKDDHPKPKASDADLKAIVAWMLAQ